MRSVNQNQQMNNLKKLGSEVVPKLSMIPSLAKPFSPTPIIAPKPEKK